VPQKRPRDRNKEAAPQVGRRHRATDRMGQNAPVPFGVPRPVGPSQPALALQSCDVLQLPLLPEVTSNNEEACAYGKLLLLPEFGPKLPARANTPAMSGAETLVPPTTNHPDWLLNGVESKTATPVLGSATAETSATARRRQPVPTFAWPEIWAWKR